MADAKIDTMLICRRRLTHRISNGEMLGHAQLSQAVHVQIVEQHRLGSIHELGKEEFFYFPRAAWRATQG
jgi:hypothetical protein